MYVKCNEYPEKDFGGFGDLFLSKGTVDYTSFCWVFMNSQTHTVRNLFKAFAAFQRPGGTLLKFASRVVLGLGL